MKRLALLTLFVSGTALAIRPAEPKAVLVTGAKVSLTVDGPLLAGKAKRDQVIDVKESSGKRYKFEEHGAGYMLGLYVDPKHLATLAFDGAELVPAMTDEALSATSPGMKLAAGQRLESAKATKGGFSKVRVEWKWQTGSFRVDGYVKSDKLTKTINRFEPNSVALEPDVTARGSFKLTATPGGKAFATSTDKERVELQTLDTEGKYTLVRTGQGVVGWIATKQLEPIGTERRPFDLGRIGGGSGTGTAPRRGTLNIGTKLYNAIDGTEVGKVTGQFDFTAQQTKDGWQRYDLPTTFGTAKVWAK